jgi:hypothetical protein
MLMPCSSVQLKQRVDTALAPTGSGIDHDHRIQMTEMRTIGVMMMCNVKDVIEAS